MEPLSERIRPKDLKEFYGQEHLTGDKGILQKNIRSGYIPSFIMWGPPGVGKTTLAGILAQKLSRPFYTLSAVDSGVKELRKVIDRASKEKFLDSPSPILFIDEIHRFSKNQQDALLKAVEQGTITLIGATTENPSFEVISPLLSRAQVYTMNSLSERDLEIIIKRALETDLELKKYKITNIDIESLIRYGGGDARKTLNLLEQVIRQFPTTDSIEITAEVVEEVARTNPLNYDKKGDQHYDIVSAFIKSVRGGNPDAAVYWLARMIKGGEDPAFICRRMIILAAEDIGLANPNALLIANNCFQSVQNIGMPEGRIPMSQAAIYLATSPKSNSAYTAINAAMKNVDESGPLPVPLHLRNAPTRLMKENNYGKDYLYPHNYPDNFVYQQYLPDKIQNVGYYKPQDNSMEIKIKNRIEGWWKKK